MSPWNSDINFKRYWTQHQHCESHVCQSKLEMLHVDIRQMLCLVTRFKKSLYYITLCKIASLRTIDLAYEIDMSALFMRLYDTL